MKEEDKTIHLYHDGIGKVQLIQHWGSDKMIVNAARVSFGKDNNSPLNDKDAKLIRYLLRNRHSSPFEHVGCTWKFTVPLFVRSQHHRHRTWAYNEISRRYTSEKMEYYVPETFRTQHKSNRQASNMDQINPSIFGNGLSWLVASLRVQEIVDYSMLIYDRMLKAGVAREQARMILPQNLYTEYYGTVSLHNALHFLSLRDDPHAQWEIRRVAEGMKEQMRKLFPVTMKAYEELKEEREIKERLYKEYQESLKLDAEKE